MKVLQTSTGVVLNFNESTKKFRTTNISAVMSALDADIQSGDSRAASLAANIKHAISRFGWEMLN